MDIDVQRVSFFVEKQTFWEKYVYKFILLFQSNWLINYLLQLCSRPSTNTKNPSSSKSSKGKESAPPAQPNRGRSHNYIDMLLSKVSFRCIPGSVTVLFGSGYENQRRLIEIIALRQTSGYLSGKITYDTASRKNGWFKDIVHIAFNANSQLSERYYSRLTVFEYLFYGARLRISHGYIECRERTRNAIKLIGLDGTATVKSLTASEVRMLSIAVELVSNPTLLCLENPIDGLDASGSIEVMSLLRRIAKRPSMPTTIVYMVKYLDDDMMRYIDNVALFTNHKLVRFQEIRTSSMDVEALLQVKGLIIEASIQLKTYADSAVAIARRGIIGKFTSASQDQVNGVLRRVAKDMDQISSRSQSKSKSSAPSDSNDVISSPSHFESIESNTAWNRSSSLLESIYSDRDSLHSHDTYAAAHRRLGQAGQTIRGHKPIYLEIYILMCRGYKHYFNNVILIRMYFGRLIIGGLLIGIFVSNDGKDLEADDDHVFYTSNGLIADQAYNTTSVMFILASISIVGTAFAIMILHTNIRIMKYEINSGLHHTFSCWVSLVLVDLPVYLLASTILATIVYLFLGSFQIHFHNYIGTMILITIAGYSLALAVVVNCNTSEAAMLYFSFYGSFSILFTGYLQSIPDLPGLWSWVTTAAFSRWAFEALLLQEYQYSPNYHDYMDQYGFDGSDSSIRFCVEWLVLWCIALQLVVVVGLCPPIYDTNFFKDRYNNRVNRRLIQEALEIDEDDIVLVEELESNTDRNRYSGSILISSPLIAGNSNSIDRVNPAVELNLMKEVNPINPHAQVTLTIDKLQYIDQTLIEQPLMWDVEDNIADSPSGSFSSTPSMHHINGIPSSSNPTAISYQHQKSEPILTNISATIKPGLSCCILDSSDRGIGKVMLQILSSSISSSNYHSHHNKMKLPGKLSGNIFANDHDGKKARHVNSVYISSGDILDYHHNLNYTDLPSSLTVKEVLTYSALLRRTDQTNSSILQSTMNSISSICSHNHDHDRLPSSASISASTHATSYRLVDDMYGVGKSDDIHERVQEIIAIMGLTLITNTIIGPTSSRARGILSSQLRCLSIATELVNRPNLIFLEDPFYGLDWFDCQAVSIAIQNLAKSGRTIIASLERPRSSAVFGYDQMLLLGSGLLLYNGLSIRAASYFENIGYEKRWDQSPLEFILDVALDKGKMKQLKASKSSLNQHNVGSHGLSYQGSVHVFSLEDLAELCNNKSKSPNNKRSSSRHLHHITHDPKIISSDDASSKQDSENNKRPSLPVGPTVQVLLKRGFYVTFSNKKKIAFYWTKYFVAGIMIGTIWWSLPTGDYQQRLGLLATAYCFVSIVMVDLFDGIYERKELFLRETRSGYCTYMAYWLADSAMSQFLNLVGSLLFIMPAYGMTQLREGADHIIYYYVIILASIYCNLGLAYILSVIAPSASVSKIVFNGFLMPLQLFMSGYLILLSSLETWTRWGAYINPMSYYLNGVFVNEFDGNSNASGDVNYEDLKDLYDYRLTRAQCLWAVICIGVCYRLIWLLLLVMRDAAIKQQGFYRSRVLQVRKKARRLVTAGLRWRGTDQPYSAHIKPSEVTNAMMEEDAFAELEANIGKSYILDEATYRSSARDSTTAADRISPPPPSLTSSYAAPKSILEQLQMATASLPDEYIPLSGGSVHNKSTSKTREADKSVTPLGRSGDSVGESSGHIAL